jgi:lipid-binding SYLF domain-containing protein
MIEAQILASPVQEIRMTKIQTFFTVLMLAVVSVALMGSNHPARAATAAEINRDSQEALQKLYRTNPLAADLSHKAKAVLIFPNIVKGGFIVGGSYGEGELLTGGAVSGYFNSASASWGLQAGAQSYGYAVFLMSDKAISYLGKSKGWEVGVGPTVVVVDEGAAKNLSSTTLKDDAYAFIFGQQGLMAGVSIEGSKITKIKR